jgi:hypothetical protein
MKKMNKMYEAPKAELINLDVNKDFMQGATAGSGIDGGTDWDEE